MTAGAIVARARGRLTTVLADEALAAAEHAHTFGELAAVLARTGLAVPTGAGADAIDRIAGDRVAADLVCLARWSDALAIVELDEDRRSVRGIARGMAGGVAAPRRIAGAVPTARLSAAVLADLAGAPTIADLAAQLARRHHPLAPALAGALVGLFELELRLARRFADLARSREPALRAYVAQAIDAENAAAALVLAMRGAGVPIAAAFVPGGRHLDRERFAAAARGPGDAARTELAAAFAGTPLVTALFALAPAALEDAALAWQLATQTRLRRTAPLGLAPAIYTVLRRREEARRLRRAAWRIALGGGS